MDILLGSGNGALVNEVAKKAGLDEQSATDLLKTLGSSMMGSVKGRVQSQRHDSDTLEDLIKNSRYANAIDNPHEHLNDSSMVENGNDLLRHITGSKEASREIAAQVGQKTGVNPSIIKSLLPMLAPFVIGALGKGMMGGGSAPAPQQQSSGSLLSSLLDFDHDGSVLDDVAGMAMKYLI